MGNGFLDTLEQNLVLEYRFFLVVRIRENKIFNENREA
jgi:hypothetical protein